MRREIIQCGCTNSANKTEKRVTETPDLDTLLGIGIPMTDEKKRDVIAARLLAVRDQIKSLKEEETALEDSIWTLTPDEPGEVDVQGEQYAFTVQRTELWKWNSTKLELLAARNASVSAIVKSKFQLQSKQNTPLMNTHLPNKAKQHEHTHNPQPGKPRVKVRRKVTL